MRWVLVSGALNRNSGSPTVSNLLTSLKGVLGSNTNTASATDAKTSHDLATLQNDLQPLPPALAKFEHWRVVDYTQFVSNHFIACERWLQCIADEFPWRYTDANRAAMTCFTPVDSQFNGHTFLYVHGGVGNPKQRQHPSTAQSRDGVH